MNNRSKQIKAGAMMSYAMILFSIIAGLLYTPWMVEKIGKLDYGLYILVTSFLTYFTVDFGLWLALNKILSQLRAEKKAEEEKKVIGIATRIYLGLDIAVCMVLCTVYFYIDLIFTNLTAVELHKFKIIFIIAGIFSVLSFPFGFVKGIFSAHEYYIELKTFDFATKIGTIALTVALLYFGFGLYALVLACGLIPFILNIARVIFLARKKIRNDLYFWDNKVAKSIFSISAWLLIIVLGELFINNISPTLIAIFSTAGEVAIFGIGLTIFNYVYTFSVSINGLFLPKVTEMYVHGQLEEIKALALRMARIQMFITGFLTIGIFMLGKQFIAAWMGPEFSESYYVAVFLLIPNIFINSQQIELTYLLSADKLKYRSFMMVAAAIINVILAAILIPRFGAIGASIAICIANSAFLFIGMNIMYQRNLGFRFMNFIKMALRFLSMYLIASVCYYLIVEIAGVNIFNTGNKWGILVSNGIIFSLLYVTGSLIIANKYELQLVKSLINRKG